MDKKASQNARHPTVSSQDLEAVEGYLRKLMAVIDVQAVVLFGSRARSEPFPWSDFDIAVVSESFREKSRTERMCFLLELWEESIAADIFGFTPEEFLRLDRPLIWEIVEYGVPVTDCGVFHRARQIIEERKRNGLLAPTSDGWLIKDS